MNETGMWSWYCEHDQCDHCTNSQCLHSCHEGGAGVREPRRPLPPHLETELEAALP